MYGKENWVPVEVRIMRHADAETFQHRIPDTSLKSIETAVDYFDGQVGTVLAIYRTDIIEHDDLGNRAPLYRAMVREWDFA